MSRSKDTQFFNTVLQADYGTVLLSSAGIGSIYTPLKFVACGIAQQVSGHAFASVLQVSAISSGVVTITDPHGADNGGAKVSYMLFGN